jgi:hypothetical protein
MRFVQVKSAEQQGQLMQHRKRAQPAPFGGLFAARIPAKCGGVF